MPSIDGRPGPSAFADDERGDDRGPPAGFGTDRLSTVAVLGTFPALWLGRYGGSPLWLVAPFAAFYLLVAARALSHGRRLAALGWGLYLPALAVASTAVLPSVGLFLAGPVVVAGLVTVAYADHRARRRAPASSETTR